MPTTTAPVTYLSKFKNFRLGQHRFVNGRLTVDDPAEIAKLDARIARGGRLAFSREDESVKPEPAAKTNSDPVDWTQFTVAELKPHAAQAGISGASSMTKGDLVEALAATDYRPG